MTIQSSEIKKAIAILKPDNELFEIRIIGADKSNYSGYFKDADTMIEALKKVRVEGNIYFTLNQINEACYDRNQKDKFIRNAKATTSDNDITRYEWLMIDLDPKRPTETSSTDEQIQKAKDLGNKIYAYMSQLGFEKPVRALSGNGVHLLYRIDAFNTADTKKLLETALKTLSILFSTPEVEVDKKNFNPSRICKMYGTMAQKGTSSEKRPHRMSRILGDMENVKPTSIEYLKKLCEKYPKEPERPQRYNNYSPREFNLDDWLDKYNLNYKREDNGDVTKYILDCCPFDSNHKGKDAVIFRGRNGAIGFNCFHNSCADKTWRDVRIMFEPDAYERRETYRQQKMYNTFNRNKPEQVKPIEKQDGVPVFYTAMDVLKLPKVEETFIKTGIDDIDKRMQGLKKGALSVMSGLRASGKTSLLTELILNAVDTGNNVGCFSGELVERQFMRWMNQMAAGKANVIQSSFNEYSYYTSDKTNKEIATWLGQKFWLYNNKYGNNFITVIDEFKKIIDKHKLDLLVLDNLMAFNISGLSENKWDAQTEFVLSLSKLAKETNTHILFVAHPRKTMGFLRLEEISGTGDLSNAVDDAFIVHRVNNDFKKRSGEMFGWKSDNEIYDSTNVVEIAKNRDGGVQDVFVPLYYEPQTRRLRNSPTENRIYGWQKTQEDNGFIALKADDDAPFD